MCMFFKSKCIHLINKLQLMGLMQCLEEVFILFSTNPFWIWLSCYSQPQEILLGQTDIIMLISCDRRMQAVLFLKPTQPVFHSMIQLRPSIHTYTHAHTHTLTFAQARQKAHTEVKMHTSTCTQTWHKHSHYRLQLSVCKTPQDVLTGFPHFHPISFVCMYRIPAAFPKGILPNLDVMKNLVFLTLWNEYLFRLTGNIAIQSNNQRKEGQ